MAIEEGSTLRSEQPFLRVVRAVLTFVSTSKVNEIVRSKAGFDYLEVFVVSTKGDNEGSSELILNIFNSDNSFESAYVESGKQGADGNRSGFKGTFLGGVKVFGIWGCEEGMKASDKCLGLSTGGWSKEEVPRLLIEMKRFPEFFFNS
nr:hypothetical protein [Tanacetum cinerariifolium]